MKNYRTAFTLLKEFIRMNPATVIPKTNLMKKIKELEKEHISQFGEQTQIDFNEERLKFTKQS